MVGEARSPPEFDSVLKPSAYPIIKLKPAENIMTGFQEALTPAAIGKFGARDQPTGKTLEKV